MKGQELLKAQKELQDLKDAVDRFYATWRNSNPYLDFPEFKEELDNLKALIMLKLIK